MRIATLLGYLSATVACGLLACSVEQIADDEDAALLESAVDSSDRSVSATLAIQSDWGNGYCASVKVTNNTRTNPGITGWSVVIGLNGSTRSNLWNANPTESGGQLTATNVG